MAEPRNGPCEVWATEADVACDSAEFEGTNLADSLEIASHLLFNLTAHKYPGLCEDTVRPYNCHCLFTVCSCTGLSEIALRGAPIVAVTEVKVDGAVLDPSLYRVDEHSKLVRLRDAGDIRASWPSSQRLDLPDTEEDTFSVTYTYGRTPPRAGVLAAAELACEIAKSRKPGETCRLSPRVRSVSRQGVSVEVPDYTAFEKGLTGLPNVDMWIRSENPSLSRHRSIVVSPDTRHNNRRTGT